MAKDNIFIDSASWLFRPFDYPIELWSQAKEWWVCRKVCKQESILTMFKNRKPEIRVDNIGRIYTVVNIPEDMYEKDAEAARQTFLIEELRKVEELFLRLGISEIIYPEFTRINDIPNSYAYLLVLETNKDMFSLWPLLGWFLKMGIWTILLTLTNTLIINLTGAGVIDWILSIF
jgi:hypothetical protein